MIIPGFLRGYRLGVNQYQRINPFERSLLIFDLNEWVTSLENYTHQGSRRRTTEVISVRDISIVS